MRHIVEVVKLVLLMVFTVLAVSMLSVAVR